MLHIADDKPSKNNTIVYAGMHIVIEYDEGEIRTGKNEEGKEWSRVMPFKYGYLLGLKGKDKEGLDCYLGADENALEVYIVEQLDADQSPDELKCMIGFDSIEVAKEAYLKNFPSLWADERFGGITAFPIEEFREAVMQNQDPKKVEKVASSSFDSWFAGSKVVDAEGTPIVCYHGASEPFSRVDMDKGAQGLFWVTSNRSKIEEGESGDSSSKHILGMYVNIKNPAGWAEYNRLGLWELKRDYDGVILPDDDGTFDAIIFKSNQVRMIKPEKTVAANKVPMPMPHGVNTRPIICDVATLINLKIGNFIGAANLGKARDRWNDRGDVQKLILTDKFPRTLLKGKLYAPEYEHLWDILHAEPKKSASVEDSGLFETAEQDELILFHNARMKTALKPQSVGKTAAQNPSPYISGGWISPNGEFYPLRSRTDIHAVLAIDLNLCPAEIAEEYINLGEYDYAGVVNFMLKHEGYIRLVEPGGIDAVGFEVWQLSNTRHQIADFLITYPTKEAIEVGYYQPKNTVVDFATNDEAIDWLQGTRLVASHKVANLPSSFEELVEKSGGIEELVNDVGGRSAWEKYEIELDEYAQTELPPTRNRKKLVKEYAYEDLNLRYDNVMYEFNRFSFPINIYREITLPPEGFKALKTQGVGTSWSWDEDAAEAHWGIFGKGYTKWLLRAEVNEDDVDWESTILLNISPILGEDEREILLRDGVQIDLVAYKRGKDGVWVERGIPVTASNKNVHTADLTMQDGVQHRLECSWCKKTLRDGIEPVTSTVCDACREKHFPETLPKKEAIGDDESEMFHTDPNAFSLVTAGLEPYKAIKNVPTQELPPEFQDEAEFVSGDSPIDGEILWSFQMLPISEFDDFNTDAFLDDEYEDALDVLMKDIKAHGIQRPIVCGPFGVEGHHRIEAAKRLGLTAIPAIVGTITDEELDDVTSTLKTAAISEYRRLFNLHDSIINLPGRVEWFMSPEDADPLAARRLYNQMKGPITKLVTEFTNYVKGNKTYSSNPKIKRYIGIATESLLEADDVVAERKYESAIRALDKALSYIHNALESNIFDEPGPFNKDSQAHTATVKDNVWYHGTLSSWSEIRKHGLIAEEFREAVLQNQDPKEVEKTAAAKLPKGWKVTVKRDKNGICWGHMWHDGQFRGTCPVGSEYAQKARDAAIDWIWDWMWEGAGQPNPVNKTSARKEYTLTSALTPSDRELIEQLGHRVIEEAEAGNYTLAIIDSPLLPDFYQIGMQRNGLSMSDPAQQMEKQPIEDGITPGWRQQLTDIRAVVDAWLVKYGRLYVDSHNPEKTAQYIKLLKTLGYNVGEGHLEFRGIELNVPYIEPRAGKVGSYLLRANINLPSLEEVFRYAVDGNIAEAVGDWDKIDVEAKAIAKKEGIDWDNLSEDEQGDRLDRLGYSYLEKSWVSVEQILNSLKFPLTVYRAVAAKSIEEVNTQQAGICWSRNEKNAYVETELPSWSKDRSPHIIILRGTILQPHQVDWLRTAWSSLRVPLEEEIDVAAGTRIKIDGWKFKGETKWQKPPVRTVTASDQSGWESSGEVKDAVSQLYYWDTVYDCHGDECFGAIYATQGKKSLEAPCIGKLYYSTYKNEVNIKMIEVHPSARRMGVATKLYAKLKETYPNEKINHGMLTEDGAVWENSLLKSAASVYRSGWITADGKFHPLTSDAQFQIFPHRNKAIALGLITDSDSSRKAYESGAIRVAATNNKLYFEFRELNNNSRTIIRDFIITYGKDDDYYFLEWHQHPSGLGDEQFASKEETLEWLENPRRKGHTFASALLASDKTADSTALSIHRQTEYPQSSNGWALQDDRREGEFGMTAPSLKALAPHGDLEQLVVEDGAYDLGVPKGSGTPHQGALKPSIQSVWYHGTSATEFTSFNNGLVYLAPNADEAEMFAKNPVLGGGRGVGQKRVLAVKIKPGQIKNIDDVIMQAMSEDLDVDEAITFAANEAKTEGYRYLSMQHPGVGQEDFEAMISLYPAEDLTIQGETKVAAQRGIWYHGTTIFAAEEIYKEGWIKPGMPSSYGIDVPRPDAVYVTTNKALAEEYAGQGGVVIEVLPDMSKLIPDEDAVFEILEQGIGHCEKEVRDLWVKWYVDESVGTPSFEEAWAEYSDMLGGADLTANGEYMKEFTQMIADSHPDLAKRIMAEDDRAAHLGPVKVKPQAKVSSERYSAQQVIDHVKSLHDAATNPITYSWTTKILKQFPAWELRKVSLDQIPEADLNMSVSQPFQAAEYAKLKTPFPAIVLDDRGQIIDGNHRCWAALQRGDDAIWAYTPIAKINESKVGSIEFLPKITAAVLKKATPHEYNIAYVNVPANIAQQIIKEGEATIPDEILGADGREMNSHITVKYGVRDDVEALTEALKNQGPFQVQLGKTHVFPPSEYSHGGVPLVVQVSIPELSALKDIVDAAIGDRVDDFEFAPHITIAYIQPDKAAEYDGLDTFDGVTFTVDAVVLSRKDGSDVRVPLTGGSESKIAAVKSLSIKDLSIC